MAKDDCQKCHRGKHYPSQCQLFFGRENEAPENQGKVKKVIEKKTKPVGTMEKNRRMYEQDWTAGSSQELIDTPGLSLYKRDSRSK